MDWCVCVCVCFGGGEVHMHARHCHVRLIACARSMCIRAAHLVRLTLARYHHHTAEEQSHASDMFRKVPTALYPKP